VLERSLHDMGEKVELGSGVGAAMAELDDWATGGPTEA
jgi:hypothetical protein